MWHGVGRWLAAPAVVIGAVALQLLAPVTAFADAANPVGATTGTETLNADGTVTVAIGGTWTWSDQKCTNRFGIGWAVDWWGNSPSAAPSPTFSLTNATVVVPTGPAGPQAWDTSGVTTGTVSPAGSIGIGIGHADPPAPPAPPARPGPPGPPGPPTPPGPPVRPAPPGPPSPPPGSSALSYFHVGSAYAGEDTDLCASVVDGDPTGQWSAAATYPARADVPSSLCVNLYDEHGSAGKSSGNANDFSPTRDDDNSIQTNDYDPAIGGNCTATSSLTIIDNSGPSF
ncbi:MAG TPA: hypothetical protein VH063_10850 [Gaiellaceae bacterium]|nr:hypothetical protein [Gaiellaceae bacterium]